MLVLSCVVVAALWDKESVSSYFVGCLLVCPRSVVSHCSTLPLSGIQTMAAIFDFGTPLSYCHFKFYIMSIISYLSVQHQSRH